MATVDKNFKVKNGLVVEGTTATVNGEDIITTGSTTDSLPEGTTNVYYTEGRAKTDAAELLTGATLTNITITGDGNGLTITAENGGIQDLTGFDTDDLTEGTTNLYFTDARAQSAVASDIATAKSEAVAEASLYADGLAVNYEVAGAATTAETAANNYTDSEIDALTTDDIEEGLTNLYFTNQRALDATASAYDAAGAADTALSDAQAYADGLVQGLNVKDSVRTATTENISNLTDTPVTIGGVTLSNGDRVLVKNQSTGSQNGIYVFANTGKGTLTRAEDQATPEKGDYTLVVEGTYAATGWLVSAADMLVGNSWTQFSAANEYTASTGITITGNAISVTADTYDAFGAAAQALSDANDYTDTAIGNLPATYIDSVDSNFSVTAGELSLANNPTISGATITGNTKVDYITYGATSGTSIASSSSTKTTLASGDTVIFSIAGGQEAAELVAVISTASGKQMSKMLLVFDASNNVYVTEYGSVETASPVATLNVAWNSGISKFEVSATTTESGTAVVFGTTINL